MDELRSWLEVPAIAHYFHVFKDSFDLIEFEIEDLEETLLLDGSENVSSFLPELFIRLLRGLYKTKDGLQVTMDNYDHYLQDLLNFHYGVLQKKENPLITSKLSELPLRTKVEILYDMINWRVELEDAMELTKNLDADLMRVEPVGKDNEGNVYWYFHGCRLYKEGVKVRKKKGRASHESEAERKNGKVKPKKRRKPVALSRSGRAIRKKRKLDSSSSSEGSATESEKSLEIPDEEHSSERKPIKLNINLHNWSLCCCSVEEWDSLIEHFQGTTTKTEKQLLANLKEVYEDIPYIIKVKELKMQKKLLAMAPRRESARISYKAQQREAEEKIQEEEYVLKKQHKAEEEEEKLKRLETEKSEEREKRYKERVKMLQQRSLRAKMREEQKIVLENPELATTFSSLSSKASPNNGKEESMSESEEIMEEDSELTSMSIVLAALKEHDDAWLFLEPVKEEEAPHYYTYIKNPMDFQTIEENIKARLYYGKSEFESDVLLVFDNCETYNGTYSPFTKLAFKVKRQFHKLMKREFPPDVHENDVDFGNNGNPPKAKKMKVTKTKLDVSKFANNTPPQKRGRKPKREKVSMATSEVAAIIQVQSRTPIPNAAKTTVSQVSPISATNYLTSKCGIPMNIIKQMTPAQMQSLILRNPRPGFVPALQSLMGHKLNTSSNSTSNGTMCTTTISPLQQLANTALGPSQSPVKSPSTALPFLSKNLMSAPMVTESSAGAHMLKTSPPQTTPAKQQTNSSLPSGMVSQCGGYVSGISVSGVPITIQWDDLKKQLMTQMSCTTTSTTSGRYVSGITASGDSISIEWEELKKQLVTQMKKDSPSTPNRENIAMSSVHPNSSITASLASKTPLLSSGPSMPPLRPVVNMPAAIPFRKFVSSTTTTTNSKMFSFSNVSKNKEYITSAKPVVIKTPAFDHITSVISSQSTARTNSVSTLSNAKLLSGHSKVQDWLQSSSPFIARSIQGIEALKNVTSDVKKEMKVKSECRSSIRFPGNQGSSVVTPSLTLPRPSLLAQQSSKMVPIPLPSVHHVSSPAVNHMNVVSLKGHLAATQGKVISSPIIHNKSNILDLQKAALQAAAVNQISTKLQSHLKNNKLHDTGMGLLKYTKTGEDVTLQSRGDLVIGVGKQRTCEDFNSLATTTITSTGYLPLSFSSNNAINCFNNFTFSKFTNNVGSKTLLGSAVPATNLTANQLHIIPKSFHPISTTSISKVALVNPVITQTMNTIPTTLIPSQFTQSLGSSIITTLHSTKFSKSEGTGLFTMVPSANSASQSITMLPIRHSQCSVNNQLVAMLPKTTNYSQCARTQVVTTLPFQKYAPSANGQLITMLPSTNHLQSAGTQLVTVLPTTKHLQTAATQLITTLPSTKYLTFAAKPVAIQQSQLSRFISPISSITSLSRTVVQQSPFVASQTNPVRFQTMSNSLSVLHPKPSTITKHATIQKQILNQANRQPVRYILPAQTQLNQFGSVQNVFLNNLALVKNQMMKKTSIAQKCLPNGSYMGAVDNPNIIVTTIGITAFHTSATTVSNPSDHRQVQVTYTNSIETPTICTSISSSQNIQSVTSLLSSKYVDAPCEMKQMQPSVPPSGRMKTMQQSNSHSLQNSPSISANLIKLPDGGNPQQIVLDPIQLQKLKDEGRIVMTSNGQLLMVAPNSVRKVPTSVFK